MLEDDFGDIKDSIEELWDKMENMDNRSAENKYTPSDFCRGSD